MILWHIDISHLRESPETHHTATFSSLCQHGMHLLDKLNKLYTTRCQEGGGFQGHLVQDQKKTFNLQEQASQPLWLLYVKQLLAWKKHCCTTECSWSKKANNCSILKCTKAMTEANPSLAVDHTKGWEITSTTSWLNKETISRIVDAWDHLQLLKMQWRQIHFNIISIGTSPRCAGCCNKSVPTGTNETAKTQ